MASSNDRKETNSTDKSIPDKTTEEKSKDAELRLDSSRETRRPSFCPSSISTESSDICRICHCEGTIDEPLISPCYCLGTMKYLHQTCLQRWIKSSGIRSCELCKFEFIMHSEVKPFKQWQKLDMNGLERRKIVCSVAFNIIAVTCVLWSLDVLIEKTREEVKEGKLQWPFWTKLIIVAVGFTGGLIFLYVQCKMYFQLCLRWRQFNQRIIIHSRSEQTRFGRRSSNAKNGVDDPCNCIITVLDPADLAEFHSDSPSTVSPDETTVHDDLFPRIDSSTTSRTLFQRIFFFRR